MWICGTVLRRDFDDAAGEHRGLRGHVGGTPIPPRHPARGKIREYLTQLTRSGTMTGMTIDDDARAARRLASQAHEVGRVSGRELRREALRWITRGRLGRHIGWHVVPQLVTPWQDTISAERIGWRQRAANLHDGLLYFD
jgi:hypothetical protein